MEMKIPKNFMEDAIKSVLEEYGLTEDVSLKDCVDKQIPKKPMIDEFDYGDGYVCGECESFLHYVDDDDEHIRTNYCCHCGQAIDWSEYKNDDDRE